MNIIAHMAPDVDPAQESILLASVENRRAAEHMLATLGRGFLKKARKGQVTTFVVSANKDGSLKLTQARVLTAGGIGSALMRVFLAWTVGFMGLYSTLKGTKASATRSTYEAPRDLNRRWDARLHPMRLTASWPMPGARTAGVPSTDAVDLCWSGCS
jgi:hypothetical protein